MANLHAELLETILRECDRARPHPWYPAEFVKSRGGPREPLEACLDQLRMAGLVQLTPWSQGHGQGYELTPQGGEVLEHPRLLARIRNGEVPQVRVRAAPMAVERHALAGLRGEKVRDALLSDARPIMTQLLLAANILWFIVGMNLPSFREKGSLFIVDVVDRNQWWRLLSCGFVHAGLLHLAMNMYALYVLGPLLEKMWGSTIFLAIYLVSCVGGSAAALVFSPMNEMVGASGAICGLLGSMATWVYLNRHYLPPHIVSAWKSNILTNVVLITIISLVVDNVSLAGHAGGGLTGAIVSAPLCLARFGNLTQRVLGWLGMAAITVVGLCLMYQPVMKFAASDQMDVLRAIDARQRRADPRERGNDDDGVNAAPRKRLNLDELLRAEPTASMLLNGEETAEGIRTLARQEVLAPKSKMLDAALQKRFQDQQAKLQKTVDALEEKRSSTKLKMRGVVKAGLAWFRPTVEFCDQIVKVCEKGEATTAAQRESLKASYDKLRELRNDFKIAWSELAE